MSEQANCPECGAPVEFVYYGDSPKYKCGSMDRHKPVFDEKFDQSWACNQLATQAAEIERLKERVVLLEHRYEEAIMVLWAGPYERGSELICQYEENYARWPAQILPAAASDAGGKE